MNGKEILTAYCKQHKAEGYISLEDMIDNAIQEAIAEERKTICKDLLGQMDYAHNEYHEEIVKAYFEGE